MLDMNVLAGMNKPGELKSEIIYYTTTLEQPPTPTVMSHSTRVMYLVNLPVLLKVSSVMSGMFDASSDSLYPPTTLLTILNILTIPSKLFQPQYPKTKLNRAPFFGQGLTLKINLAI